MLKSLSYYESVTHFEKTEFLWHLDKLGSRPGLHWYQLPLRSSHRRCPIKKDVFKNVAELRGNHMCPSLFFNEVAATLLKKRLWHRCFPVNFAKFLRAPFLKEHLWWLLLFIICHRSNFSYALLNWELFKGRFGVNLQWYDKIWQTKLIQISDITSDIFFSKERVLHYLWNTYQVRGSWINIVGS